MQLLNRCTYKWNSGFNPERYISIITRKISLDAIAQGFENHIKIKNSAVNQNLMIKIEATLVHIYAEYCNQDKRQSTRISTFDPGTESLKFKTTLTGSLKNKLGAEVSYATSIGHEELKTVIQKIEINEHFYTMG